MNNIARILFTFLLAISLHYTSFAQKKSSSRINDIFFEYVSKTLELKPEEAVQMRPLVKFYLFKRKKIINTFSDPLEREQQILTLKINSRKRMAAIIGMPKANAFFASEQSFRKKVREELRQRYNNSKKN